jgi:predicted DCC family thiol-disulfide oxidoreductase YuxK
MSISKIYSKINFSSESLCPPLTLPQRDIRAQLPFNSVHSQSARRMLDEVRDAWWLFLTHFKQGPSETADTVFLEKRLTSAMRWRHVHIGERLELSVTDRF